MGGSAKAPQVSDEQRKMEKLQMKLLKIQLEQAQKPMELPKIPEPKPMAPPPPPPSQLQSDAPQAEEEARRKMLNRTNSGRGTIFAGATTPRTGMLG